MIPIFFRRMWALCCVVVSFMVSTPVYTQISASVRVGIFGSSGLNFYSANFRDLPGYPSSNPGYTGGTGIGFDGGVSFSFPFKQNFYLMLRTGYSSLNASMTTSEFYPISVDGSLIEAVSRHTFKGKIGQVFVEPQARWYPLEGLGLSLMGGVRIASMIKRLFDQEETLEEPTGRALFLNGNGRLSSSRNAVYNEEIPDYQPLPISLTAGFAYEIPFSFWGIQLNLSPEIQVMVGLESLSQNRQWNGSAIRGGLHLEYGFTTGEKSIAPETPPQSTNTGSAQASSPGLQAAITAYAMNSENGLDLPVVFIRVEEFIARQLYPMLTYLFFDPQSAVLPARYQRLFHNETQFFSEKRLAGLDLLDIYYNILNVVGKRMTENTTAKLRIVGCLGEVGFTPNSEENAPDLSKRRAETIRQYLRDVWQIPDERLIVEFRALPEKFSNSRNSVTNAEENRRVELYSDDWNLLRPVVLADTVREVSAPIIKFALQASAFGGISKWSINVKQGGKLLKQFSALGEPDPYFLWNVSREKISIPRADQPLSYSLEILDANEREIKATGSIPVAQMTTAHKRQNNVNDKELDLYRLINFEFERSNVTSDHKKIIENFIVGNIKPHSQVTITGYTDVTGDPLTNQRLSLDRAKAVSEAIGIGERTTKGVGSKEPIYPSNLPEGRFYNRTVEIRVETQK